MKKFRFSLETVLDYKQKTLDALQVEYGNILARLRRQEQLLDTLRGRYNDTNMEYRERKQSGLTVAGLLGYEVGLQVIEREIHQALEALSSLQQEESEAHARLIESKIDASSLELLREKKLVVYQHEVLRQEERMLDDLFSSGRHAAQAAL